MDTTTNFVKADSSNLPNIDIIMLLELMKNNDKYNAAEIRGAKALMSSRDSYVESAVGYVEVKRTGSQCSVRAKVVPEHKIRSKYYTVTVHINETEDAITDTACDGCAAAAGGCKHTIVFLHWLQKRSMEPSPTSVECYWVKPNLKKAAEEVLSIKDLVKSTIRMGPTDDSVLQRFRDEASKHACMNSLIVSYDPNNRSNKMTDYCIFDIMVNFVGSEIDHSYKNFMKFCDQIVRGNEKKVCQETIGQANSKLWHGIRQGRITGSKIYEVAHCRTPGGSLVEEILGGHKVQETKAMKRGKILESSVLKIIQDNLNEEINESGIILVNGLFGASPDGISDKFVIEIKCPITEATKKNYIKNGQIAIKYNGQVKLEMLATGKQKCLFCVADPKFETNGKVEKIIVDYDAKYIENLMSAAEEFWQNNVFPIILKSASS